MTFGMRPEGPAVWSLYILYQSWRLSAAKRGSATPAHTIPTAYLTRVGARRRPARGGEAPAKYV